MKMTKENIIQYFNEYMKTHNDIEVEYEIPDEMKDGNSWKLCESSITEQDICELEKEFNITLPQDYKNYLMVSAHMFTTLTGNFDNFCYDNDVDIELIIPPQPYKAELMYIKELYKNNAVLVNAGYIPLGQFDEDGWLCIDLENDNELVWVPFECCVGFTKREEFETEQLHIFYQFADYITCFFEGKTHEIE